MRRCNLRNEVYVQIFILCFIFSAHCCYPVDHGGPVCLLACSSSPLVRFPKCILLSVQLIKQGFDINQNQNMKLNVYQRNMSLRYITGQLIDTLFKFRIRDCTVMVRFASSSKSKVVNEYLGNGNC